MTPSKKARLLARVSLLLTGLVFGGFGLVFLISPEVIELTGVVLTTPASATEIRGFYGGMELGFALFFVLAALRVNWFVPALVAQASSLGGMALGRLIGVAVDGHLEPLIAALMAAETAGSSMGLAALWYLTRSQ